MLRRLFDYIIWSCLAKGALEVSANILTVEKQSLCLKEQVLLLFRYENSNTEQKNYQNMPLPCVSV